MPAVSAWEPIGEFRFHLNGLEPRRLTYSGARGGVRADETTRRKGGSSASKLPSAARRKAGRTSPLSDIWDRLHANSAQHVFSFGSYQHWGVTRIDQMLVRIID